MAEVLYYDLACAKHISPYPVFALFVVKQRVQSPEKSDGVMTPADTGLIGSMIYALLVPLLMPADPSKVKVQNFKEKTSTVEKENLELIWMKCNKTESGGEVSALKLKELWQ